MIPSRSLPVTGHIRRYRTILNVKWLAFCIVLAVVTILINGCICGVVEYIVYLNIENKMPTDITIELTEILLDDGEYTSTWHLGTIHAGQTEDTPTGFIFGGIGAMTNIILEAKDPSGNIVWKKTLTGEEFVKLRETGWKIVISPETSDVLPAIIPSLRTRDKNVFVG